MSSGNEFLRRNSKSCLFSSVYIACLVKMALLKNGRDWLSLWSTLDLGVMGSSSMLGMEITKK